MNLEQTAISLIEQFPTSGQAGVQKPERALERFGRIAFGGFGLMVVLGVAALILVVFTRMVLTGPNVWAGLLLIGFLIFAALTLTYVFLRESLKDKKEKPASHGGPAPLPSADTGKLLESPPFQPVPSVTEDTTELLKVESKTRKL